MKKLRKFVKTPGLFFRDYFAKRYPVRNTELSLCEVDEVSVISYTLERETLLKESVEQVDVVFTWVNHSDLEWRKKYNYEKSKLGESFSFFSIDEARFANHNELYYSLFAVKTYLPWVNRIYIITDGQKPEWLSEDEEVIIIDHKEIIDHRFLPTFNSHVIEAHLHKIPNLSEHFIYFNDDVFVGRPLSVNHFFSHNRLASLFVSDKPINCKGEIKKFHTPTLDASQNSSALIKRTYGYEITRKLVHTYQPLKKVYFQKAWDKYNHEIVAFLGNKFRGDNDLNLATFLVPWLAYCEGAAIDRLDICYYFNIRSPHAKIQYQKLLNLKLAGNPPHSFCANDFVSDENEVEDYSAQLQTMLDTYYFG